MRKNEKDFEAGQSSTFRFPPWLSFVFVGFGILFFSFVLILESRFQSKCECIQQEKKDENVVAELKDYNQDLWWVKDPPEYAENVTWLKGWFPEKTMPNGILNVTPALANQSFFWKCFTKHYSKRWEEDRENALTDLTKWLLLEPAFGFNKSCAPPPLVKPENLRCKDYSPLVSFTGEIRKKPRKIGVSFGYAFETEMLELQLMEVYDVVDKIFLTESSRTHISNSPKPLFWEQLKWTPRFRRYQDKVVHFVLDDLSVEENLVGGKLEAKQDEMRFNKIVEWNRKFKFFEDDDLIAMGHCDEIVSRNVIHALKYCEIKNVKTTSVDAVIWFVHQSIRASQVGYCPVRKLSNFSYAAPTFHSFAKCNATYDKGKWLTRDKGKTGNYAIPGGLHLSWYPNPFQLLMKRVSCSECRFKGQIAWSNFTSLKEFTDWLIYSLPWDSFWLKNADHEVRGSGDPTEYYPWALYCNPFRYRASVFLTNDDRIFYSKDQLPFDTC